MKLKLHCGMCEQVKETAFDVEELRDAEADEVCPACFVCNECLDEDAEGALEHTLEHFGEHS